MAQVHDTTMAPTKLELLTAWLPTRAWYVGGPQPRLSKSGGFRLDDPAGEVGIEFVVVTDASGSAPVAYLIPMTYRGEPLSDADAALIGTSEHGVLGKRWLYDAPHDPVFVAQLASLLAGEADPQSQNDSDTIDRTIDVTAAEFTIAPSEFGSGPVTDTDRHTHITLTEADGPVVRLHRVLGHEAPIAIRAGVEASWSTFDGAPHRGIVASILLP